VLDLGALRIGTVHAQRMGVSCSSNIKRYFSMKTSPSRVFRCAGGIPIDVREEQQEAGNSSRYLSDRWSISSVHGLQQK
jgi:hypothetical protein